MELSTALPMHPVGGITVATDAWPAVRRNLQRKGGSVLEVGDIIPGLDPYPILTEPVELTWSGGYITKIDGGLAAHRFEKLLASYQDKESYGLSHLGFGTHEKAALGSHVTDPQATARERRSPCIITMPLAAFSSLWAVTSDTARSHHTIPAWV